MTLRSNLKKNTLGLAIMAGFVALTLGGLVYEYETLIQRPKLAFMGVPKTTNSWQNLSHVLRNDAYLVEYSERLANPLWVSYQVTGQVQKTGTRSAFKSDWRSPFSISTHDYTGTGYDRGHLAPNYLIGSRYGKRAQAQTFLMTNISPQKPNLNRKIWQRLEEISADYFSKWYGDFWVVTGPIFDENPETLSNSRVAIPIAFYKIFIRQTENDAPKVLAFWMPQTVKPNDSLEKYVVTVDAIEKATGIDFFHLLPDDIEQVVEAEIQSESWQLEKVANLKNRY